MKRSASSSPPSLSSSKRRKPNFSEEELLALCAAVTDRQSIIDGTLDNQVTVKMKLSAWEEVATAVSRVGGKQREAAEVRKKFSDYRSLTKKKKWAEANRHDMPTGNCFTCLYCSE